MHAERSGMAALQEVGSPNRGQVVDRPFSLLILGKNSL